jgi:formamidopyrimidine-DNA glycosylase
VAAVRRRGKYFLFDLDGESLIVHLGMTGQLLWWNTREEFRPDVHTHAHLCVSGGGVLSFRDARKFGQMFLLPTAAVDRMLGIGVEPLDDGFTAEVLRRICRASGVRIKTLLLDQRKVAGIGNIYADESLFRAGIRHRGSSISDFRDPYGEPGHFAPLHRVYHRHGQPCVTCRTPIRRIVLGQRGTHFCPTCQR